LTSLINAYLYEAGEKNEATALIIATDKLSQLLSQCQREPFFLKSVDLISFVSVGSRFGQGFRAVDIFVSY